MSGFAGLAGWFRRQPVRLRVAFVSAALTAVILIGFAAVVGRLVADRLNDDFRQSMEATAQILASNLRVEVNPDGSCELDPGAIDVEGTAIAARTPIRIVDAEGRSCFEAPVGVPDLGPPGDGELREGPGRYMVIDRPVSAGFSDGPLFVQYADSRRGVDATIGRLWVFLIAGVVVGSLLAGFAGMAVAGRTMSPIARLTSAARSIAITRDPSTKIPAIRTDDEVAELARTLDQMLRELDAARSEAEATVSRQREFVADASHELRTPLTSILANLEMLEESLETRGEEDDRAATRSALRSTRRMSRLVGDLLTLARADAGRFGERLPCDLAEIARGAFDEVSPVAEEHRLEVSLPGPAPISGNPDELHRMVLNLLENAVRHTPPGTRVQLHVGCDGERAVLIVDDDGPGLPEDKRGQIFERFVRMGGPADRVGRDDGTGLGLSIVRAVAEAHEGSVVACTSPFGGARFEVRLPAQPVPARV